MLGPSDARQAVGLGKRCDAKNFGWSGFFPMKVIAKNVAKTKRVDKSASFSDKVA
jgi:hypothetical protein